MRIFIFIFTFLISITLFGQKDYEVWDSLSRTLKWLDDSGRVFCKFIQLDRELGKNVHYIEYYENGQKMEEGFKKNKINYDTIRKWTEKGELHNMEIYSDTGYTEIEYWQGLISLIGKYQISYTKPDDITIYDSVQLYEYKTEPWSCDTPYYVPIGVWKYFHENEVIESEGEYLPFNFYDLLEWNESKQVYVGIREKDFENNNDPDKLYIVGKTYLKNGWWFYYNDKGIKTKEEFYKNGLLVK